MEVGDRDESHSGPPAWWAGGTAAARPAAPAALGAKEASGAVPPRLGPLLSDLSELKRVRSHGWPGRSLADAAFRRAWADLAAGALAEAVAVAHVALSAAHTRLGAVDELSLAQAGVSPEERRLVYRRAAASALGPLSEAEAEGLDQLSADPGPPTSLPPLADALADTRWLEPHAEEPLDPTDAAIRFGEHAYAVAIVAAAIARDRGDDMGAPFLLGLVHHAPEVGGLPTGSGLPAETEAAAGSLIAAREDLSLAAAIAFNAADGIDAVAERRAAVNQAGLSLTDAVSAEEIAPPGPMRDFHVAVVRALGLAY